MTAPIYKNSIALLRSVDVTALIGAFRSSVLDNDNDYLSSSSSSGEFSNETTGNDNTNTTIVKSLYVSNKITYSNRIDVILQKNGIDLYLYRDYLLAARTTQQLLSQPLVLEPNDVLAIRSSYNSIVDVNSIYNSPTYINVDVIASYMDLRDQFVS